MMIDGEMMAQTDRFGDGSSNFWQPPVTNHYKGMTVIGIAHKFAVLSGSCGEFRVENGQVELKKKECMVTFMEQLRLGF